jgi:hypothetical protein
VTKSKFMFRAVTAIAAVAIAVLAGANAVVNATRVVSPQTSLAIDAGDAIALAQQTDNRWAKAAAAGEQIDLYSQAQRSIAQQAINPRAVRLLGFSADLRGNRRVALLANDAATRLSRRESGAQLWLMENDVERNDVSAVLKRYDVLLSTNGTLRDALYPKLALALSDPQIRDAFVPYVRKNPIWLSRFLGTAVYQPNPDALSYAIRQAGGLAKNDTNQTINTVLLGQLFATQKVAEGRAFFRSLPGADARLLTSAALTNAAFDAKFAPVSWVLTSNSSVGATVEKANDAHAIKAFALSGATGVAASKYLFILPGTYRFGSAHKTTSPSPNARAAWALRCLSSADQPILYQFDIIRPARSEPPPAQVTIPPDCPVQRLDLTLAGGDDSRGLELLVSQVNIGN